MYEAFFSLGLCVLNVNTLDPTRNSVSLLISQTVSLVKKYNAHKRFFNHTF